LSERQGLKAVLFDFYDTLAYRPHEADRQARRQLAETAGATESGFAEAWRQGRDARMLDGSSSLADQFREALDFMGAGADDSLIARLVEIQMSSLRDATILYEGVLHALQGLRQGGWKLGLVTNCSSWGAKPIDFLELTPLFDAIVRSCDVGVLKPDPEIFAICCRRLGVAPEECVFVADGAFGELDAAHALGMVAVKVVQDHQSPDYGSSEYADFVIGGIPEVPGLMDHLACDMENSD
jgi:putative hydrolase of the HAD superfamily